MNGRVRLEHTTSLLERTMREINRRVDPPGNRWLVPGVRSMVNLILARRFDHPAWWACGRMPGRSKRGPDSVGQRNDPLSVGPIADRYR
jgi:hypothetical protein